jgi:hypothetical protein
VDGQLTPLGSLASLNPAHFFLNHGGSGFPDFFLEGRVGLPPQALPPHEHLDLLFPLLPFRVHWTKNSFS